MSHEQTQVVKLIGAGIALLVGLIIVIVKAQGMGPRIVVVAPQGSQGVKVSLDGGDLIHLGPGEYHVFSAGKGKHKVQMEDIGTGGKRTVDAQIATNTQMKVVPAGADQCFAVFDITRSHYRGRYSYGKSEPDVVQRERAGEVFTAPPETYFSLKTVPEQIEKGVVHLAVEADCHDVNLPDGELAAAVGI